MPTRFPNRVDRPPIVRHESVPRTGRANSYYKVAADNNVVCGPVKPICPEKESVLWPISDENVRR